MASVCGETPCSKSSSDDNLNASPCPALWMTPIIRSDGKVSVCLSDIDGHMDIGDLSSSGFLDVWLKGRINQYRYWHQVGKQKKIAVCSHCTYYEANRVDKKVWEKFQELTREESVRLKILTRRIQIFNNIPKKILTFDLTNSCNLSCFFCTWHQDKVHTSKPRHAMTLDQIKKVCNEFLLHGSYFDTISLSVSGEPFMNPQFDEIITYLFEMNGKSERFFKYISINTNGTVLTRRKVDLIHNFIEKGYGSLQLTISINAGSAESFQASKNSDLYDQTVQNVRYLLREKARLKITYQENIYLQFLVNEKIESEAEAFRDFWLDECKQAGVTCAVDYALPVYDAFVVIIFKRIYADITIFSLSQEQYDEMHRKVIERLGLKPKTNSEDLAKNLPIFNKTKKICGSPFISPIIRGDGTLNYCLTDATNRMPIGNVFEKSFFELWLSNAAENFRLQHIRQNFKDLNLCRDCNYFDGISIPDHISKDYLDRAKSGTQSMKKKKLKKSVNSGRILSP